MRQIIAARIAPYGKLTALQIDTASRRVDLSILLDGEPGAVDLTVQKYQILEKDGSLWLLFPAGAFTASRVWLGRILNLEVAGRTFQIPAQFATHARTLAG